MSTRFERSDYSDFQAECKALPTGAIGPGRQGFEESEQRRTALEAELASAHTQRDSLSHEREQLTSTANAIAQRAILAEHKVVEARFRHEALSNESDRLGKELTFTMDRAALAGQHARSTQDAMEKDLQVVREQYGELHLRGEALAGALDAAKTDNRRLSEKLESVAQLEATYRAKCSHLEAELVEVRSERDAFSHENISLAAEVRLRSTDVVNLQTTLFEERARLNQQDAEFNAANAENQQLAGKLAGSWKKQ